MASDSNADRTEPRKVVEPLPRLESTYSVIIQRAVSAAKARSGLTQRIKAATQELRALVPHTRRRFSALSWAGKIATVLVLVSLGAALALGGVRLLGRRGPAELRAAIADRMAAGDWVAAKDLVGELRATGALTDADRLQLVTGVESGMQKLRADLQRKVQEHEGAARWDDALASLDAMERAGFSGEWMLFSRAEILRLAGRSGQARAYYARYAELYPATDRADDALFWSAEAAAREGDRAAARRALERLLAAYPGSNFRQSARRMLGEL